VIVVPYDPAWKQDFEKIRLEILDAAADLIERIEHVGSTSVEGLWAKPIIDILAEVSAEADLSESVSDFPM